MKLNGLFLLTVSKSFLPLHFEKEVSFLLIEIQVDVHSKPQVQIPARDYDIDHPESEIACC